MKKLLALLLSLLMATSLCIFAGCEIVFITDDSSSDSSSDSSNNSSDDSSSTSEDAGKVDLIGISASVNTEVKAQSTQKTSALSLTLSYNQVITELKRLGYTTRNGQPFSYTTLNAMLKNEKYCGVYVYNRKGGKKKKNRVLIENFDEVRNETAIPPIIDKKTFDKVQKMLKQRTMTAVSKIDSPYILTGLIYCKQCGAPMSGATQTGGRNRQKYRTYACPKHHVKNRQSMFDKAYKCRISRNCSKVDYSRKRERLSGAVSA